VDQAEAEHGGGEPRPVLRPAAQPDRADEGQAQRDHDVDEERADVPVGDRGGEQGDAVPEREQGDQLRRPPDLPGQEQNPTDERQVVPPGEHVRGAQPHEPADRVAGSPDAVRERGLR
jgi:hypothetical protein